MYSNSSKTLTADRYCKELKEMHYKLTVLKPELVNRRNPILLHDNARFHVSKTTVQKLNEKRYKTLSHLSYSADLSPTNYHFFKKL
uniref:Mariner Mos1 transposase n=1 Tax=Strongyloides papillosus TaxID=174720 RepID=A0A0N5BBN1_STREA